MTEEKPIIESGWQYEWAPSFIQIRNFDNENDAKMTIAHEVNHACQYAYTYKDLYYGDDEGNALTWFYEGTAVLIAEEVYNYQYNYFLTYFGVPPDYASPSPLRNPEFGILDPTGGQGLYNYAGFLWPKFLNEWTNDPDMVRKIWFKMSYHSGEHILDDTNFMLGTQHSKSLDEAVRYYAEWRYYTGDRDDGFHFSNASVLPTSQLYANSPYIYGFGGTFFIEFELNREIVNVTFDGQDNYPWIASVIEDRDPTIFPGVSPVNKKINLNANYSGEIDAIGIYDGDYTKVILTPILNIVDKNRTFTYNGIGYGGDQQYFYNKIGTTNAGGYLRLDNNADDDIQSGDYRWLRSGSTHNIMTLNERFVGAQTSMNRSRRGDILLIFPPKADPVEMHLNYPVVFTYIK